MDKPTYQLWDGTTAQIGSTKSGKASTDPNHIDQVVFTGVTYSQLPNLRLRIFANSGSSQSGARQYVDYAVMNVSYLLVVTNVNITATVVPGSTSIPVAVVHSDVQISPTVIGAITTIPAPTVGTLVTATPSAIAATTSIPTPTITSNASITASAIGGTSTIPTPTVTSSVLIESFVLDVEAVIGNPLITGVGIGTPYNVLKSETAVSAATSYQVTATTSTVAGDAIVVFFTNNTTDCTGITDSAGNTYNLEISEIGNSFIKVYCYVAVNTSPLTAGVSWIKATFTSATGTVAMIARAASGIVTTSTKDSAGEATGQSSTGSTAPAVSGSTTRTQASEWMLACISNGISGGSPSNWTGNFVPVDQTHVSTAFWSTVADQITGDTSTVNVSATILSARWTVLQVALKGVLVGGASPTPSTVPSSTSIPTPVVSVSVAITATAISATTSVSTPAVATSDTVTPAVIAASTTIFTPAVSAAGNVNVQATAISATTSIPAPVVHVGSTVAAVATSSTTLIFTPVITSSVAITASAIAATTTIPTPVTSASSTATPTRVPGTTAIFTPTITSNASASAAAIPASTSIPAPVITSSVAITATAIAGTTTIFAPTITSSAAITATAVNATTAIFAGTVSVGSRITATAISVTTTIPTPQVIASGNVNVFPSIIAASTGITAPVAHSSIDAAATTVLGTTSIYTPPVIIAGTGSTVTPTAVLGSTLVPSGNLSVGSIITAAAVSTTSLIPLPHIIIDITLHPSTILSSTSILPGTFTSDAVPAAPTIMAAARVWNPSVSAQGNVELASSAIQGTVLIYTPLLNRVTDSLIVVHGREATQFIGGRENALVISGRTGKVLVSGRESGTPS